MHENLIAFPTSSTFSNSMTSIEYHKLDQSNGTHFNIAKKNFLLSFQHQALSKTQKQLVMHDLQQTKPNKKKKEVKWMVPIIIGSCCTQLNSPSNMNDEIQKVGKFKQCSWSEWSTHTSSLIPRHITNMNFFGMPTTNFECTWGWPKMFASLNYMQWKSQFFWI